MNSDWQRHVVASSRYLELGMLDDAALALEVGIVVLQFAAPEQDRFCTFNALAAAGCIGYDRV